jgi:acyl-CoA thioester hydrolase
MTVRFLAESHWPGRSSSAPACSGSAPARSPSASAAFKDDLCIAAAEMTVVRLKGKTPHPIDRPSAALEKYR